MQIEDLTLGQDVLGLIPATYKLFSENSEIVRCRRTQKIGFG